MSVDKQLMLNRYSDYDVVEIAPKVYKINEFNLTTTFLIIGEKKAVTIDCATGVKDYLACVRKLTDLPLDLIVTHAHVDHIGGRGQFDKMYLSEKDEPIIKDVTVSSRKGYVLLMKLLGFKVLKSKEMKFDKVKTEPELCFLKEGDVIDLGGRTLSVFETPGHTLGSLSFLLNEGKILFTGDVINPQCLMFLKHAATLEVMKQTCKKILAIQGYDTLWASHLSTALTKHDAERAIATIEKAQKLGNRILPWIAFANKDDFMIIHKANRRK